MLKKFKKSDLVSFYQSLNQLGNVKGAKFSYAVVRNINLMKPEVEALDASMKMSDEYVEFDKKRVELAKEHAKKNEDGTPVVNGSNYEVEDTFEAAFEALKEENKAVYEARLAQIEEYNSMLDDEVEVDVYMLKAENMTDDLTPRQVNAIFAMLED